jgi:hypothetical protein
MRCSLRSDCTAAPSCTSKNSRRPKLQLYKINATHHNLGIMIHGKFNVKFTMQANGGDSFRRVRLRQPGAEVYMQDEPLPAYMHYGGWNKHRRDKLQRFQDVVDRDGFVAYHASLCRYH